MKDHHLPDDPQPSDLSPHLFWDCKAEELDWEQHKALIVSRVLQRGLMRDWLMLRDRYGVKQVAKVAMQIRTLDRVALSFIASVSGTNPNHYLCSIQRQSTPTPWNS